MCCVNLCDVDSTKLLSRAIGVPVSVNRSHTREAELKQIQQKLDTWTKPSGSEILCLEFYGRELAVGGLVIRLFWG